jgi:hypothetical protein
MIALNGTPGELRATIEIKRKDTGKVDTFQLIGHPDPEVLKKLLEEANNGSHAQHNS